MEFALIILLAVFVLIAVRQVGSLKLGIWQIMLFGAVAVLLLGQISAANALKAINWDVMLFLFGMFVVGEAMRESGYLSHVSYRIFRRVKNADQLVLMVLFGIGILSAFLMNDTLAIIGTPLVLHLAKRHKISPKLLLLALAFAITTGSVMSPIGNPQNLLIAIGGGVGNPFLTFLRHLAIPTLINLALAYALLKLFYRGEFHAERKPLVHSEGEISDSQLAGLSRISLGVIASLILLKIFLVVSGSGIEFSLTYIALLAAAPILIFGKNNKRFKVLWQMDWRTLIFFAAMFVLMESVWETGVFQAMIAHDGPASTISIGAIMVTGVLVSQLISNVPFIALYLPLLVHLGASSTAQLMALAAGSTIAGNLLILGAASNVIIIQNAEKMGETLTFWEFARVGIPLTVLNVIVYWLGFLPIG